MCELPRCALSQNQKSESDPLMSGDQIRETKAETPPPPYKLYYNMILSLLARRGTWGTNVPQGSLSIPSSSGQGWGCGGGDPGFCKWRKFQGFGISSSNMAWGHRQTWCPCSPLAHARSLPPSLTPVHTCPGTHPPTSALCVCLTLSVRTKGSESQGQNKINHFFEKSPTDKSLIIQIGLAGFSPQKNALVGCGCFPSI